jgi:Flp pilus assembly protein TadD
MPSGRIRRAEADAWFEERRVEAEAAPDDWRSWFRLAHAYNIVGDRRRAREAMRKALDLS